jgi:16S rRNA (adenine(1408)-N(1))-methyltransferase
VDLGTGDGRAAIALARREPAAFVLGLDANAAVMAESSLRAARPARKGGLPNLWFAVAAAEQPPDELCGRVGELSILFPWASLLRGALALEPGAATGIAGLLAPAGRAQALVSVADRDAAATDLPPLTAADGEAIGRRWAAFGLALNAFRPATVDEVRASGSTWGRRLLAGRSAPDRPVWRLELGRDSGDRDGSG